MATIDKLLEASKKSRFKKIEYRPWNFMDELDKETAKTGDTKSETKRRHKKDNKGATKRPNRDIKRTTKGQLKDLIETTQANKDNTETTRGHLVDKNGGNKETKTETIYGSVKDNTETTQGHTNIPSINSVGGSLKTIVLYLYHLCKNLGGRKVPNIPIDKIATDCNTNSLTTKKSLQRLEEKGLIIRHAFKRGRGGWTTYEIPNALWQELIIEDGVKKSWNMSETNRRQMGDINETTMETKSETHVSSSRSYDLNNITTNTEGEASNKTKDKFDLDQKWKEVDIEPLSSIKFTITHLQQIASQNALTPEVVQDSIYHYAFDLKENDKAKAIRNPLNYFMGILRKKMPYNSPDNYESPQDRNMRIYVEKKREIEQRRAAMEKEAFELSFKEWFYRLSDDEIRKFLPPNIKYTKGSKMAEGAAREYFSKEIWENKQMEILNLKL